MSTMSTMSTSARHIQQLSRTSEAGKHSFDEVVRLFFGDLLQVARRFLDPQSSEDVVQEVLVQAWQQQNIDMRDRNAVLAYLRNKVVAMCRHSLRQGSQCSRLIQDPEQELAPWEDVEAVVYSERAQLVRIITQLPEKHKRVLEQRYLSGMSVRASARQLGLPLRVWRLKVRDAQRCLQERLCSAGFAAE